MSNTHKKLHNRRGLLFSSPELQIRVCPVYYLYIAHVERAIHKDAYLHTYTMHNIYESIVGYNSKQLL